MKAEQYFFPSDPVVNYFSCFLFRSDPVFSHSQKAEPELFHQFSVKNENGKLVIRTFSPGLHP